MPAGSIKGAGLVGGGHVGRGTGWDVCGVLVCVRSFRWRPAPLWRSSSSCSWRGCRVPGQRPRRARSQCGGRMVGGHEAHAASRRRRPGSASGRGGAGGGAAPGRQRGPDLGGAVGRRSRAARPRGPRGAGGAPLVPATDRAVQRAPGAPGPTMRSSSAIRGRAAGRSRDSAWWTRPTRWAWRRSCSTVDSISRRWHAAPLPAAPIASGWPAGTARRLWSRRSPSSTTCRLSACRRGRATTSLSISASTGTTRPRACGRSPMPSNAASTTPP